MKSYHRPCTFCGEPVDTTNKFSHRRVTGWERSGQSGGSDIILRERQDEWCCLGCIEKKKSGRMGQGAFI